MNTGAVYLSGLAKQQASPPLLIWQKRMPGEYSTNCVRQIINISMAFIIVFDCIFFQIRLLISALPAPNFFRASGESSGALKNFGEPIVNLFML